ALVRQVKQEWFLARLPDETLCVVRKNVRQIAFRGRCLAVDIEPRIDVGPLPFETDPMIKTWPRAVVVADVPLADVCGLVAGALQQLRECDELASARVVISSAGNAVRVRIESGQEARTTGKTQRRGDERIAEQ